MEIFFVAWSTGKLHSQALTLEVAAICNQEGVSKEGILKEKLQDTYEMLDWIIAISLGLRAIEDG
jgi:hypothetical protein